MSSLKRLEITWYLQALGLFGGFCVKQKFFLVHLILTPFWNKTEELGSTIYMFRYSCDIRNVDSIRFWP
jgi:hypothetical protein